MMRSDKKSPNPAAVLSGVALKRRLMALAGPPSRFTPQFGGGSAFDR
jgi:hypothetical protein